MIEMGIAAVVGIGVGVVASKVMGKGNSKENTNKIKTLTEMLTGEVKIDNEVIESLKSENDKDFTSFVELFTKRLKEEENIVSEISNQLVEMSKGKMFGHVNLNPNTHLHAGLVNGLNSYNEVINQVILTMKEGLKDLSEKNYTKDYEIPGIEDEMKNLLESMSDLSSSLSKVAREDIENVSNVNTEVGKISDGVEVLSTSQASQAIQLEETAAAIEEISGNLRSTSEKTGEMLSSAEGGLEYSKTGLELIKNTTGVVKEINEYQKKIAKATEVIDQISFQTNILSLNAAVEAATAGEHGKGFAVVATEVRNLAAKSAEASDEIKSLVSESIKKAQEGSDKANQTLESFNSVIEKIQETKKLVEIVDGATNEQSIGISQINDAINQLDTFTQSNASVAGDVKSLNAQAVKLAKEALEELKNKDLR